MLHDRVTMLGSVRHDKVRDVLVQGQIFLNTSRTEAFCIGIVEAASCGLLVVTTKVGGVPEVLPDDCVAYARPEPADLVQAVLDAVSRPKEDPWLQHGRVKNMYSWRNVAERTEKVYRMCIAQPDMDLVERWRRYYGCGLWAGKIFAFLVALDYLIVVFLEWLVPSAGIERCPRFAVRRSDSDNVARNADRLDFG